MTRAAPVTALPRSDTVTTNPPCPSWIVSTTTSPPPPGSAITSPTLRSPGRTVSDTDRTLLVLPVRSSVGSAAACGRRWPASECPPEVRRRYTDDPGGHRLGCRRAWTATRLVRRPHRCSRAQPEAGHSSPNTRRRGTGRAEAKLTVSLTSTRYMPLACENSGRRWVRTTGPSLVRRVITVAGRGLVWHLPATTVAGCGLTWPDAGGRWLPVWLPRFVSAVNLQQTRTAA